MKVVALFCSLIFLTGAANAQMPQLIRQNGTYHLLVDGEPFIILGAQVGNSSAWPESMEKIWPLAKAMNCNVVQAPVYWEAVEAEPNHFDFSTVDSLVEGARQHGFRLILAWFGSFKNGKMDYVPAWIKQDNEKYPRMLNRWGEPIRVLSTHFGSTFQADTRAYIEFIKHLKRIDGEQHTVIMIQIQNEPGALGAVRDHSEIANIIFEADVPSEVLQAFEKSSTGSWEYVFGRDADETFAAYYLAKFINIMAEKGKEIYPLPTFVNVWTDIQADFYDPGFSHPSGGATTKMLPLWKKVAPAIDMICPDIYKDNYMEYRAECAPYARADNVLFVPETGRGLKFARRMFYPLGEYHAIGVSVFGVDKGLHDGKMSDYLEPIANNFKRIAEAWPLLNEARTNKSLRAAVEEEGLATIVHIFANFEVKIGFGWPRYGYSGLRASGTKDTSGRVLIGQLAPDEFIVVGFDAIVNFRPARGGQLRHAQVARAEEGKFVDGKWRVERLLNGDETFLGVRLDGDGTVVKLKLTKY